MSYSNCLWLLLILPLLVISACSNFSDREKNTDDISDESDQAAFVLIANPYQPAQAPARAKQEFARAKILMQEKKWQQARDVLELMTQTFPELSGPYVNLGIVYHELEQLEKAEKALQFGIETNPYNFDAYPRLGFLYREQGRFEEAEQVYINALALWPHHLDSTTNLGILYDLYMGRFDDALRYYELSLKIAGGEDRQLQGWIIDLKRRLHSQ